MATTTMKQQYRCTWCGRDCAKLFCDHCGCDFNVVDRSLPHTHEWSRKTINSVECKICDEVRKVDNTNSWGP